MDERSKRAQMERKRRIRRKKQRRRVLISALVEVLILAVLAFAFCWNRGLGTKISGFFGRFDRPPVKELDVTGVNSSNVVLMDVKSGAVIGDLNGKEQIYPRGRGYFLYCDGILGTSGKTISCGRCMYRVCQ